MKNNRSLACSLMIAFFLPGVLVSRPSSKKSRCAQQDMHSKWVASLALSPDGNMLATGSLDQNIILWNTNTGRSERVLIGHTSEVTSLAFSSDGAYLASGGDDNTARMWDVHTGRLLHTFPLSLPATVVAFSPDGALLACGTGESLKPAVVYLFDVPSGKLLHVAAEMKQAVYALAFSPDSKLLAVNGAKLQQVNLWDVQNGALRRSLKGPALGEIVSLAFSPDGQWVAGGTGAPASPAGALYLWSVRTGQLKWRQGGAGGVVWSLAFSPDAKTILHLGGETGHDETPFGGPDIARTDVKTGDLVKAPDAFRGSSNSPMAFAQDGSTVADFVIPDPKKPFPGDMVGIWNARTGILKNTFQVTTKPFRTA